MSRIAGAEATAQARQLEEAEWPEELAAAVAPAVPMGRLRRESLRCVLPRVS